MAGTDGVLKPAAAGGLLWAIWALALRPEWTAVLLVFSPFVLLPLGLGLASLNQAGPAAPAIGRLANWAPVVAVSAATSFLPQPGLFAACLSLPWLAFTAIVAAAGIARTLSRTTVNAPGIAVDAALMFLVVGGAWLTISRAGGNPLGFSDAIVQLTAVHFHYAGFALPIVAGLAATRLDKGAGLAAAVIVGVPFTAIGITAGGWLEWAAASFMAGTGLAVAGYVLKLALTSASRARWLLAVAALALTAGMSLAWWWAWSIRFGWAFLGLDRMAATHGSLNALGFGLIGLIGFTLLIANEPGQGADEQVSVHLGRPAISHQTALLARATTHSPTNEIGLLKRSLPAHFQRRVWRRTIDHGDFAAACTALREWRGHGAAGITLTPSQPPIAPGQALAIVIPVGPISVSGTSQIVEVIDTPDRYGFTYATLPHHPVDGEESFIINRHAYGYLEIIVTAVWRRSTVANQVCPPFTRYLQNRAINKYLRGITDDPELRDSPNSAILND